VINSLVCFDTFSASDDILCDSAPLKVTLVEGGNLGKLQVRGRDMPILIPC
jgi:hypothetical protein